MVQTSYLALLPGIEIQMTTLVQNKIIFAHGLMWCQILIRTKYKKSQAVYISIPGINAKLEVCTMQNELIKLRTLLLVCRNRNVFK